MGILFDLKNSIDLGQTVAFNCTPPTALTLSHADRGFMIGLLPAGCLSTITDPIPHPITSKSSQVATSTGVYVVVGIEAIPPPPPINYESNQSRLINALFAKRSMDGGIIIIIGRCWWVQVLLISDVTFRLGFHWVCGCP